MGYKDIAYTVIRKMEVQEADFPMNPTLIAKHQQKDVKLPKKGRKTPEIGIILKL
jgi:hypothetical protein